jgi:hypothetical protein
MKSRKSTICCVISLLVALGAGEPAFAIRMGVYISEPYQVMTTGTVRLGHTVTASTDFNRLTAGGTYVAQCAHPQMLPVPGQRTLSTNAVLGGLSLTVTIPENQPAYVAMPGFESLPRGTTVNCTYSWTAKAVEGGYTAGGGGISVPVGQGEAGDGATRAFVMKVPSDTDPNKNSGCIP